PLRRDHVLLRVPQLRGGARALPAGGRAPPWPPCVRRAHRAGVGTVSRARAGTGAGTADRGELAAPAPEVRVCAYVLTLYRANTSPRTPPHARRRARRPRDDSPPLALDAIPEGAWSAPFSSPARFSAYSS